MSLFLSLTPRAEAWDIFKEYIVPGPRRTEIINVKDSIGRVLAKDILSPIDLPGFIRSTRDGYAVSAASTFGASQGLPALLTLKGRIRMGEHTKIVLDAYECANIATGGMLPKGADAVVMVENCEVMDEKTIAVAQPVAPGENVVGEKEDVSCGALVLLKGNRLRPADMAALAALGIDKVEVSVGPKIAIISTGDELVDILETPLPGQIRDMNAYALYGAIQAIGGKPKLWGIVRDDYNKMQKLLLEAYKESDMLIVSGGSSIGDRDFTRQAIQGLGNPGILVHGVGIKPGKPTILAMSDSKPIFGLPGHPMSCLVVFNLFVAPTIAKWMGTTLNQQKINAKFGANAPSIAGREDYISVRLRKEDGDLWADPIFRKSATISGLVHADGTIRISVESEGVEFGENVTVTLF